LKPAATLFHVTALLVFIQTAIGGLVVLGYVDTGVHVMLGYLVFLLSIVTLAGAGLAKPRYRPALAIAILLVLLILVQGILGFAWLGSKDDTITAVHLVNALVIYGLSVAGVFAALRWSTMASASPQPA
jgi:hypothetical protein